MGRRSYQRRLQPGHCHEVAGIEFRGAVGYDAVTGVLRSDHRISRGGERESKSAHVRIHAANQLLAMLREQGSGDALLTAPDGAAFVSGMPRVWFLARLPSRH